MRFWEGLIFMNRKDRYCKKADRDESGKRVNPAKNWHKRKKKDGINNGR